MGSIVQLSEHVSNQIAAGEVVGRPASVVKELIENCVDAGASEIAVVVVDAGRTLIQVVDNGKGMSEEDAKLCFKRHATSKISTADDLLALVTKGFRGEALASISAVAQVDLKTREAGSEMGTKVVLSGSDTGDASPVACPEGTQFAIKNLFFNVPARRNFLKSDQVEMRHIIDEFQRVAMAHPDLSFRLQSNGSDLFNLKPGSLRQRVVAIFGSKHDERLVPIEESTDVVKISGFVGKPSFARRTRGEQFLFVNGRFIKHPLMHKAIMNAYEGVLSPGHFPLYTIFLEVDPKRIDVNIHPTKVEAKFEEDQAIFAILRSAIKRGLGKHNVAPSLDFDTELSISIDPLPSDKILAEPQVQINPDYNPFKSTGRSSGGASGGSASRSSGGSMKSMGFGAGAVEEKNLDEFFSTNETEEVSEVIEATEAPKFFQFANRFIITSREGNLLMIDARRAHQRILFEQYLSEGKGATKESSQKLLFPEPIDLTKADTMLLVEASEVLVAYGLELEERVEGGVEIISVPTGLAGKLHDCIDSVLEALRDGTWADEEGRREKLAAVWAKAASMPKSKKLTEEEMSAIIGGLFSCESPAIDPWGQSVLTVFDAGAIDDILG